MLKTLSKRGNSHALVIDKALMEQLGITPTTQLQLVVSNGSLIVTPARVGIDSEELKAATEQIFERYEQTFRDLAK